MIGEVLLGLFALSLGWMSLRHAFLWRARRDSGTAAGSSEQDAPEDRPLMIVPFALGILFILLGAVLLTLTFIQLF